MDVLKIVLVSFLATMLMLVSCAKNDASDVGPSNAPVGFLSSVAVFNTIPHSTGLTMAMGQGDSQKLMISASDNLVFGRYVTYKNWFAGDFTLFIQNQEGNNRENIQKKQFLAPGKVFSLFFYRDKEKIETVLSEDNVINAADGKAKIRVAHLNEGLSQVNVNIGVNNGFSFKNIKYESVSNYLEIDAQGTKSITVQTTDGKFNLEFKDNEGFVSKGLYTILLKKVTNESDRAKAEDFISVIKQ